MDPNIDVGKHTHGTELTHPSKAILFGLLSRGDVPRGVGVKSFLRLAGLCCLTAFTANGQTVHSVGNIFDPRATPAQLVYSLSLLVMSVCAAIFLVVAGLLTFTIVRFRRNAHDGREPAQVYGSSRIEIAWTVIPILIVLVLTMATARAVLAIQNKRAPADALHVTVIGHQWWWEIRYGDLGIVTANELHVPVSTTAKPALTFLKLESADVAHSFWVPQLSGKTDLIPNQTNSMWIDPQQEGTFLGNCAEYCGMQHANMLLRVVVQSPGDFEKWAVSQRAEASHDLRVEAARSTFLSLSCVSCHTVSGTSASGTFGPDLSHLLSRATLGSGVVSNTPENLRAWVKDPQAIKPGNLMPSMQLNSRELDQVFTYLSSLK
jgi:cytochrome c oxidase subunit 2